MHKLFGEYYVFHHHFVGKVQVLHVHREVSCIYHAWSRGIELHMSSPSSLLFFLYDYISTHFTIKIYMQSSTITFKIMLLTINLTNAHCKIFLITNSFNLFFEIKNVRYDIYKVLRRYHPFIKDLQLCLTHQWLFQNSRPYKCHVPK